jgi:phosphotriesterase-related protein
MGDVMTARGAVPAERLGRTLMHEHVFIRTLEIEKNWPTGWDERAAVEDAVVRLTELKDAGIDTIVDLTVPGLGRDAAAVVEVAGRVELNIVMATGYYTYHHLPHYFDFRGPAFSPTGTDALEEFFTGDIDGGLDHTSTRPGILKCATDEAGLTPDVERILRAVAKAHRKTGIPISTHTHAPTRRGLDQQRVFAEEGVDLSRVVIGHSGDTTDLDYLEELLRAGSTLGMDRFGVDVFCPFEQRVDTVARLCERGWAGQLVLSHDTNCHIDWFPEGLLDAGAPNWHFLHISRDVLPALRECGVTEEQIDDMLIEAPRRILDHGPGY